MKNPGVVIIIFFIILLVNYYRSFDDTDNEATRERSGMSLYTDHGTGCQYVQAGLFGDIMPRLDSIGNQVGCR